jgi:zinc protease
VQDLRDWYRRWYAPDNSFVVIVGDVDAARVIALARRFYGRVGSRTLAVRKPLPEPPQRGLRRVNVKAPAEQGYLLMGYKAPTIVTAEHDWEPYALEVLATVLAGYDAARLNQALVREKRLAHEVSASYSGITRGPGMLYVDGVPAGDTGQLESALREHIAALAREPVSAA